MLVAHTLADKLVVYGAFTVLLLAILTAALATLSSRKRRAARVGESSNDVDRAAPSSL